MKLERILVIATFIMIVTVAVWAALRPDLIPRFNLVLLAGLIAVTTIYAYSTIQISRASKEQAEEMREQRVMASRPVIIQRAVAETETELRTFGSKDYFSYFAVYNAGNGPAIEVEISLLNKEKMPIDSERRTFLRASDPAIKFCPSNIADIADLEGSTTHYFVCEYQSILSRETWYQTWLPFKIRGASKEGEVYVISGELEFKEVTENERIDAFGSGSKPK